MWLRSQDKYILINASCIEMEYDEDVNLYKMYVQNQQGAYYQIAIYSTEKVALNVLNSIEEELCDGRDFYQMPEDFEG